MFFAHLYDFLPQAEYVNHSSHSMKIKFLMVKCALCKFSFQGEGARQPSRVAAKKPKKNKKNKGSRLLENGDKDYAKVAWMTTF